MRLQRNDNRIEQEAAQMLKKAYAKQFKSIRLEDMGYKEWWKKNVYNQYGALRNLNQLFALYDETSINFEGEKEEYQKHKEVYEHFSWVVERKDNAGKGKQYVFFAVAVLAEIALWIGVAEYIYTCGNHSPNATAPIDCFTEHEWNYTIFHNFISFGLGILNVTCAASYLEHSEKTKSWMRLYQKHEQLYKEIVPKLVKNTKSVEDIESYKSFVPDDLLMWMRYISIRTFELIFEKYQLYRFLPEISREKLTEAYVQVDIGVYIVFGKYIEICSQENKVPEIDLVTAEIIAKDLATHLERNIHEMGIFRLVQLDYVPSADKIAHATLQNLDPNQDYQASQEVVNAELYYDFLDHKAGFMRIIKDPDPDTQLIKKALLKNVLKKDLQKDRASTRNKYFAGVATLAGGIVGSLPFTANNSITVLSSGVKSGIQAGATLLKYISAQGAKYYKKQGEKHANIIAQYHNSIDFLFASGYIHQTGATRLSAENIYQLLKKERLSLLEETLDTKTFAAFQAFRKIEKKFNNRISVLRREFEIEEDDNKSSTIDVLHETIKSSRGTPKSNEQDETIKKFNEEDEVRNKLFNYLRKNKVRRALADSSLNMAMKLKKLGKDNPVLKMQTAVLTVFTKVFEKMRYFPIHENGEIKFNKFADDDLTKLYIDLFVSLNNIIMKDMERGISPEEGLFLLTETEIADIVTEVIYGKGVGSCCGTYNIKNLLGHEENIKGAIKHAMREKGYSKSSANITLEEVEEIALDLYNGRLNPDKINNLDYKSRSILNILQSSASINRDFEKNIDIDFQAMLLKGQIQNIYGYNYDKIPDDDERASLYNLLRLSIETWGLNIDNINNILIKFKELNKEEYKEKVKIDGEEKVQIDEEKKVKIKNIYAEVSDFILNYINGQDVSKDPVIII